MFYPFVGFPVRLLTYRLFVAPNYNLIFSPNAIALLAFQTSAIKTGALGKLIAEITFTRVSSRYRQHAIHADQSQRTVWLPKYLRFGRVGHSLHPAPLPGETHFPASQRLDKLHRSRSHYFVEADSWLLPRELHRVQNAQIQSGPDMSVQIFG